MGETTDARLARICAATTQKLPAVKTQTEEAARREQICKVPTQMLPMITVRAPDRAWRSRTHVHKLWLIGLLLLICVATVCYPLLIRPALLHRVLPIKIKIPVYQPTAVPFNPNLGAVLPTHRVVAFYGIPEAEATGPAYELTTDMLTRLQEQGAEYGRLDPTHPIQLGIDLVASVPDSFPGPSGYYSHHLDADTIQTYLTFCQKHNLILFLDLDFGRAPIMQEVNFFLPYLERYSFVQMAVDPEWMFPRGDGVPGVDLSNVRASDLNPIIEKLATLPMKYHVPRKILLIHQYRGDGDRLANPHAPGKAEIADKRDLTFDPRVDVVIHTDGVGGFEGDHADKTSEYERWVAQDMRKYHNFRYGGFKLFYQIEASTGVMTPRQVLALKPAPLVITYGN